MSKKTLLYQHDNRYLNIFLKRNKKIVKEDHNNLFFNENYIEYDTDGSILKTINVPSLKFI